MSRLHPIPHAIPLPATDLPAALRDALTPAAIGAELRAVLVELLADLDALWPELDPLDVPGRLEILKARSGIAQALQSDTATALTDALAELAETFAFLADGFDCGDDTYDRCWRAIARINELRGKP